MQEKNNHILKISITSILGGLKDLKGKVVEAYKPADGLYGVKESIKKLRDIQSEIHNKITALQITLEYAENQENVEETINVVIADFQGLAEEALEKIEFLEKVHSTLHKFFLSNSFKIDPELNEKYKGKKL